LSEHLGEQEGIQEGKDNINQCLAVFAQASKQADGARTNVFEDVSTAKAAVQVVVTTTRGLVSAKRISIGQWGGEED